uniref:Uncharacterized protein n=1 Tax=Glossina palpalis gambiensis TaxID=67801 RepID=A0A1B0AM40_9MUSC
MYYTHISQFKEYLEERNVSKMDQRWNTDKGLYVLTYDLFAGTGAENVIERKDKTIRDELTIETYFRCTLIKLGKKINLDRVNFVALGIHHNFSPKRKENVTARVFPLSDNVTKYYGAVFYVACTKRNGYMECFVVEECKKIWPEMGDSPILNENYLVGTARRMKSCKCAYIYAKMTGIFVETKNGLKRALRYW